MIKWTTNPLRQTRDRGKAWPLLFLCSLLAVCQSTKAQSAQYFKGISYFEIQDYQGAIPHLEKALYKKGEWQASEPLAYSYSQAKAFDRAVEAYDIAKASFLLSDTAWLHLAEALLYCGRPLQAIEVIQEQGPAATATEQAARLLEHAKWVAQMMEDSAQFNTIKVALPYNNAIIGPQWYKRGLILAGADNKGNYDIYHAPQKNFFSLDKPKEIKGWKRKHPSEGPASISKKREGIYYSSTFQKYPDPQGRSTKGRLSQIYFRQREGENFKKDNYLNFNSWQFSNSQPSINEDGTSMVFVSNRPGGYGGTDLYKVELLEGGWGIPQNLGPNINSEGNELFPVWMQDSILYFASDAHPGLGGLDIFISVLAEGEWSKPQNLGYPLNTCKDDFGMILLKSGEKGYFVSNRENDTDQLYAFIFRSYLQVSVLDSTTKTPLPNAELRISLANGKDQLILADEQGRAQVPFDAARGIVLNATAPEAKVKKAFLGARQIYPGLPARAKIELPPAYKVLLKGKVKDRISGQTIQGASISCYFFKGEPFFQGKSDARGSFQLKLKNLGKFFIEVSKEGYKSDVIQLDLRQDPPSTDSLETIYLTADDFLTIQGEVVNLEDNSPLGGVEIRAIDSKTLQEVGAVLSNDQGVFWIVLPYDSSSNYSIISSANNFFTKRIDFEDQGKQNERIKIGMEIVEKGVNKLIKTVYFDFGKTNIKLLSQRDLNEIKYFLEDNPEAYVEINSYTDSRGSASANLRLSRKRSQVVREFILSNSAISPDRIKPNGFGERNLVNQCDDRHPCTEAEHSLNRRSEIRVVKL